MKRLISLILAMAFVLFMSVGAMAAGSSVTLDDSGGRLYDNRGNWIMYVITATCVGDDGTGAIADTDIRSDSHASGASTGIVHGGPEGWCLYKVIADPGSTTPDDDTDVKVWDEGGVDTGEDLLGGNGTALLDSDVRHSTHPAIDGQAARQPIIGTITLDVDGQTAVDALYVITLIFVRP